MVKWLQKLFDKYRWYVLIDGADNSITLSPALVKEVNPWELTRPEAFVFFTGMDLGFSVDYLPNDTTLVPIQYNAEYKSIGFGSTAVAQALYRWGLPFHAKVTLSVRRGKDGEGRRFYKIIAP